MQLLDHLSFLFSSYYPEIAPTMIDWWERETRLVIKENKGIANFAQPGCSKTMLTTTTLQKTISLNLTSFKSQIPQKRVELLVKIVQAAVEEGARVDSLFLASNQLSFTDLFTVLDPLLGPGLELGRENNYIVNLDISFNRLAWDGGEKLQLLISSLHHLERLDARGNEIKGSVSLSLYQKKECNSKEENIAHSSNNLRTLLLSRNEITTFSLAAPHSNLEHLDLDHNELGRISILDVVSVAHLNVSSNQLHQIPPCIRLLANLKTLDLSQNLITSVTSACLPDREKGLRHIDLSYNNITLIDPSCLDFFYSLNYYLFNFFKRF